MNNQTPSLFDFDDYKKLLFALGTGVGDKTLSRSQIAQATGVQPSYVSQVLNGKAHLSAEQMDALATELKLTTLESQFILVLLEYNRTSKVSLQKIWKMELDRLRKASGRISKRVEVDNTLTDSKKALYYSNWHFAAIHVAIRIKRIKSIEQLSKVLGLSKARISAACAHLVEMGLIEKDGAYFKVGKVALHLDQDSPWITQHHTQLKLKAIELMQDKANGAVHFSAVCSLGAVELKKIREILLGAIQKSVKQLQEAPDEELALLSIDFSTLMKDKG